MLSCAGVVASVVVCPARSSDSHVPGQLLRLVQRTPLAGAAS